MNDSKDRKMTWKEYLSSSIVGGLTVAAVVLTICWYYNQAGWYWMLYLGWALLAVGLFFTITPAGVLRRRGGVPKGKSWVKTTVVVDKGPYAVVRHPIYAGWIVEMLALMLISQHWLVAVLAAAGIPLICLDIWREDRWNAEKFGEAYVSYRQRVPMLNIPLGLLRLLTRRR